MNIVTNNNYPLYKYLSREKYLFDLLKNRRLYFNSFRNYNDPYEIFTYIHNTEDDKDYINRIVKDEVKACCFSRDPYEYLLWSHYANSHKGFCIEFDFGNYRKNDNQKQYSIIDFGKTKIIETPITYSHYKIDKKFVDGKPSFSLDDIINITIHKYSFWKYEKENRLLIIQKNPGYIEIPKDVIKGVYYGILVFDERIKYIDKRIKNLGYNIKTKKYSLMVNIGRVM